MLLEILLTDAFFLWCNLLELTELVKILLCSERSEQTLTNKLQRFQNRSWPAVIECTKPVSVERGGNHWQTIYHSEISPFQRTTAEDVVAFRRGSNLFAWTGRKSDNFISSANFRPGTAKSRAPTIFWSDRTFKLLQTWRALSFNFGAHDSHHVTNDWPFPEIPIILLELLSYFKPARPSSVLIRWIRTLLWKELSWQAMVWKKVQYRYL